MTTSLVVTLDELAEFLSVSKAQVRRWLDRGMPSEGRGARRRFDVDVVESWLVSQGIAQPATTSEAIARTYTELAVALGMSDAGDPARQIARWCKMPGFPGRPGTPGKRDGYFPVAEIREWLNARERRNEPQDGDELRALDVERRRLALELDKQQLLEQLGRLVDVETIAAWNRQCVSNAVAMLEPLADDVVRLLPAELSQAKRAEIHSALVQLVDNVRNAIADMIAGDDDSEDDDSDDGA